MGFNCGIVGLPNVGKSTIFNALTHAGAEAANYPFCTIEPNVGIVPVPDSRLDQVAKIYLPKKVTPTSIEFIDIAGLVEGASKGEGLGNKFLGHIREVDAIAHIVRCFENPDVVHVHGQMDPLRDVEVIRTELLLADLQTVTQRLDKASKLARVGDKKALHEASLLEKIKQSLNEAKAIRELSLSDEEQDIVKEISLITTKPTLYICNVSEGHLSGDTEAVSKVKQFASLENADVIVICGSLESEIFQLPEEDRANYLKDYGLKESGLHQMIRAGYHTLSLRTFFTVNPNEARAWTISSGTRAPQAAGKVHSDFEKGFIRAEVFHYDDLIRLGTEHKVKEAGLMRSEGKDYEVQDGDVLYFRFNV